jgi:hypothetical protein
VATIRGEGDPPRTPGATGEVLGKADALLARHRPTRAARAPEPPADFPELTEIISGAGAPAPVPAMPSDLALERMENELRLELLGQMGAELERLIEVRVHERLATTIGEILDRTRADLATEVRRAVRSALDQVIEDEVQRLRGQRRTR